MINFPQFVTFAKGQIEYGDTDPHVSLFTGVAKKLQLSVEEKLWLGLLYMAYYQDGSCWYAFKKTRARDKMPPLNLPISYQRRGLFGGKIERHFEDLLKKDLVKWLVVDSWEELIKRLQEVYGNGRWASYTTAELLVKLGAVPVKPTTYEIAGSTGPSRGLKYLGLEATEDAAKHIRKKLDRMGLPTKVEQLESVLCNWSRMVQSDFYLGHNFDRQQGRILKVEAMTHSKFNTLWNIRKRVFDPRCLGELNGWVGVDSKRKKLYASKFIVIQPWERRS